MLTVLQLLAGLGLLLLGGEWLVRGSSRIAIAIGMSRLLIGLTVVSFGTSAPELAISMDAVFSGTPEIALGNIVGSNISNVLLILGVTAVFYPISVAKRVVWVEVPVMIGFSILFLIVVLDGTLSFVDGVLLMSCMIAFIVMQIRTERRAKGKSTGVEMVDEQEEAAKETTWRTVVISGALIVAGIAMLWFGANWLVDAAVSIATSLGVSQLVIGLTIVAIGSSAPEIVTALAASRQGHPEMAVGSVLGSNTANLLTVGGMTALLGNGIAIPDSLIRFDLPVMLAAAALCLPIFASGRLVSRTEGFVFLALFCCFNIALFMHA